MNININPSFFDNHNTIFVFYHVLFLEDWFWPNLQRLHQIIIINLISFKLSKHNTCHNPFQLSQLELICIQMQESHIIVKRYPYRVEQHHLKWPLMDPLVHIKTYVLEVLKNLFHWHLSEFLKYPFVGLCGVYPIREEEERVVHEQRFELVFKQEFQTFSSVVYVDIYGVWNWFKVEINSRLDLYIWEVN